MEIKFCCTKIVRDFHEGFLSLNFDYNYETGNDREARIYYAEIHIYKKGSTTVKEIYNCPNCGEKIKISVEGIDKKK